MKKKSAQSSSKEAVAFVEKLAREEGIKPEELLARAGVSHVTWWSWRNGKRVPDKKTLLVIRLASKSEA